MEVGDYKFDAAGNLMSATLTVGPHWNRCCPPGSYRVGSKMEKANATTKEKHVWAIAHEEQGHGMLPITSPEYLRELIEKETFQKKLDNFKTEIQKRYPDDVEKQHELELEFAVKNANPNWHDDLETAADKQTLRFLEKGLRARIQRMLDQEDALEALRKKREEKRQRKATSGGAE